MSGTSRRILRTSARACASGLAGLVTICSFANVVIAKSARDSHPKAAEGSRTPRPVGVSNVLSTSRSVLKCGCPLPLFPDPLRVPIDFEDMRQNSFFCAGKLRQHTQILERRRITFDFRARSDLFEQPAHDFAGARLGQRFSK